DDLNPLLPQGCGDLGAGRVGQRRERYVDTPCQISGLLGLEAFEHASCQLGDTQHTWQDIAQRFACIVASCNELDREPRMTLAQPQQLRTRIAAGTDDADSQHVSHLGSETGVLSVWSTGSACVPPADRTSCVLSCGR